MNAAGRYGPGWNARCWARGEGGVEPLFLTMNFGIIYCATGDFHFEEALRSAQRSREVMPDVGLTLFTDKEHAARQAEGFERVIAIENPAFHYNDKIEAFERSPYEKTLFVDTDTYWLEPAYELIDLLDHFDVAYTHEVHRGQSYEPDCPECFAEPCTAVMAFRKNEKTERLWREWRERFQWEKEHKAEHPLRCVDDQGAFRHVLYRNAGTLLTYVLPAEYNLRVYCQWFAGARVKLVHGRGALLRRALKADLNGDIVTRIGDGMRWWERRWFNLKRWIKIRLLKRYAIYDFRLQGLDIHKKPTKPGETTGG